MKQVLDESSKLSPEVLYDDQGRESILITEPRIDHGKWTSVHGTTKVFRWHGDSYGKIRTIPWEKKLLSHEGIQCGTKTKDAGCGY